MIVTELKVLQTLEDSNVHWDVRDAVELHFQGIKPWQVLKTDDFLNCFQVVFSQVELLQVL